MSQIYIDADHRGFGLKKKIIEFLRDNNYQVKDLGSKNINEDDDYSQIAIKLGEKVVFEKTRGILICASGVGVCMAVNKVAGIRAALCTSEKQARMAREDDDVNVLCLSSDLIDEESNLKIVKTFLETVFSSEEKHIRRINKIKEYEKTKFS